MLLHTSAYREGSTNAPVTGRWDMSGHTCHVALVMTMNVADRIDFV